MTKQQEEKKPEWVERFYKELTIETVDYWLDSDGSGAADRMVSISFTARPEQVESFISNLLTTKQTEIEKRIKATSNYCDPDEYTHKVLSIIKEVMED